MSKQGAQTSTSTNSVPKQPQRAGPLTATVAEPELLADSELMAVEVLAADDLEARERRLPAVPDVFEGGSATVPSSVPLRAVVAAYHGGHTRWERAPSEATPYFQFEQPQSSTIVSLRPNDLSNLDEQLVNSLWARVKTMGDLDVDVLLASLAQWMDPANRLEDGTCWITAKAILDYRGVLPKTTVVDGRRRRAGHRLEDIADIARCWTCFDLVWVEVVRVQLRDEPRRGKRGGSTSRSLQSRLLTITDRVVQTSTSQLEDMAVAWRFRPGRCFEPFLQRPNRQTARLLQRALTYDPYHQTWPKRLARYFLFHERIAGPDRVLSRRIRDVLNETGLFVDRRNPERCKRKFESAMNLLVTDGLIGPWAYSKPRALNFHGWLETWLGMVITVQPTPSAAVIDAAPQRLSNGAASA